jgi:2-dehydropantoate 2-reductase
MVGGKICELSTVNGRLSSMRLAVVGSGGVGGYFGGRLAAAGADVAFLARGPHLAALQSSGLRIESPMGALHVPSVTATDDPSTIGPVDVVFFAVKLYDTEGALALLPPLIGPDTVVVPFQNGVDSVDVLTRAVGRPHVAGGTAYVAAVITEPGVIRHTAMDTIVFGELDGSRSPRLEQLLASCAPAGFHATLSDHIQTDIWAKFVRLSTFSGMTAVTRSPVGIIREDADLLAMWQAATLEAIAVANASGVALPPGVFDEAMKNLATLPPNAKSSMLEDLERGRRLELPWLSGAIVRMGREAQVETPIHRFIAAVLGPMMKGKR